MVSREPIRWSAQASTGTASIARFRDSIWEKGCQATLTIALSFVVVSLIFVGESVLAANFSVPIRWKQTTLRIQFIGQIQGRQGHEYFSGPFGVSVGSDGHLYVVDVLAHQILVFDGSHPASLARGIFVESSLRRLIGENQEQRGGSRLSSANLADS
jgi:NHL repeat